MRLAGQVSPEQPPRELDMLLSSGERISMALLCMALVDVGVPGVSLTGSQAGIITDTAHGRAKILEVRGGRLRDALARGQVPVVAGFQGVSTEREVTTMGRGASDTTAVALAAVLGAEACEIYTDVTGVFSADPRVVPEARRLPRVGFDEMLEYRGERGKGSRPAVGRVRSQPPRQSARAFEFHLGARDLGGRGGRSDGTGRGHRGDPRRVRGQGDRERRRGPSRHRRHALSRPRGSQHQRGPDRPERLDGWDDRHLLHGAQGGRRRGCGRVRGDEGLARCLCSRLRPRRGSGLARRRGYEVPPRRDRDHVRDTGQGGDQHRDDLHLVDPHLVRDPHGGGGGGGAPPPRGSPSRPPRRLGRCG